jgi:hypothetical protein
MAISPQHLNKAFLEEVGVFEKKIDSILVGKSISEGQSISLDIPSGMTSKHFDILKTRYVTAGWSSVIWESDQREGSWLTFTY